jgi:hypothetical protein
MARIYAARPLKDGPNAGKFHYTVSSDEEGWCHATGYCADGCPGHETREGAEQHYEQYILDHHLKLDGVDKESQKKCCVCGSWTQGRAYFTGEEYREYPLCDEHRTRGNVEALRSKL